MTHKPGCLISAPHTPPASCITAAEVAVDDAAAEVAAHLAAAPAPRPKGVLFALGLVVLGRRLLPWALVGLVLALALKGV